VAVSAKSRGWNIVRFRGAADRQLIADFSGLRVFPGYTGAPTGLTSPPETRRNPRVSAPSKFRVSFVVPPQKSVPFVEDTRNSLLENAKETGLLLASYRLLKEAAALDLYPISRR
jgi:hypothetical protein